VINFRKIVTIERFDPPQADQKSLPPPFAKGRRGFLLEFDNRFSLFPLWKREAVKKLKAAAKSAFLVVQGTEKFAPAKSGGQE